MGIPTSVVRFPGLIARIVGVADPFDDGVRRHRHLRHDMLGSRAEIDLPGDAW